MPQVTGIPDHIIIPEDELKKPWVGWEAEHHKVDVGSVTVVMFVKDIDDLRKGGSENRFF